MVTRTLGRTVKADSVLFPVSIPVVFMAWELAVRALDVPGYLLPAPSGVLQALWYGLTAPVVTPASLLYHMGVTLQATLTGLLVGGIVGFGFGIITAQSRWLERLLMPYIFGLQSLPKAAIAPLILIWFGFGLTSRVVLASLLAFFPLFVNTYSGMRFVDEDYFKLFRSLRASWWQTLWKLRFPMALPMVFAGLDIASVQALLGSVVAEFISGQSGIGVLILQYQYVSNTSGVFAALIVLALAGIGLHAAVRIIERKTLFWRPELKRAGISSQDTA